MSPVFRHGRLRLYLLRLLDEEPRHGYEVIRLLRDRFMGIYAPSPGTIYPRLARLEEEGLVTHDEENGRKVYRITEAGREELRKRGDELDELERELSASVSDIVREVREDVRETVRNLREELTWAAREMRRNEKEAHEEAREQARQAHQTAREQARQVREQARQARDEAREQAHRIREEAASLRDDALGRLRAKYEQAAGQHWSQATGSGGPGEHGSPYGPGPGPGPGSHSHGDHDWSNWLGWGDWTRWTDWPGRKNWAGPRDMGAFHDLERLAREFAGDLRKVAWESEALGGDVIVTLRNILEDTLDRIKTEIFGQHDTAEAAQANPAPDASAPGQATQPAETSASEDTAATSGSDDSSGTGTPEEPLDSPGTPE
jgi:DNA-binding PadR family transcriptional regulator